MIIVLHITPHLGGGVGKAISGLIAQARASNASVRHIVACLEKPEKSQFVERILKSGGEVIAAPDRQSIDALVATADIVQLEWWNHPATIECLCNLAPKPLRLLVWCHVSGLHNPIIPLGLMEASHRFLFTSPCTFEAREVSSLAGRLGNRLSVVSSGGGFDGLPEPVENDQSPLSVGYFGSLNFAKLHPAYFEFLSAVNLPGFTVKLIGDLLNRETLEKQCESAGRSGILDFRGYTTDVAAELRSINVLAYLLNPRHYGTAENALLEAMAMGIVPIVLDNPAERHIVEHLCTGLIVHSPDEFSDAIDWLEHNPSNRSRIGMQAAAMVRERFTAEKMEASLSSHYEDVMDEDKKLVPFRGIFGTKPDEWFLSCQREPEIFGEDGEVYLPTERFSSFNLLEKTKGSVFHFLEHYPESTRLQSWATRLETLR